MDPVGASAILGTGMGTGMRMKGVCSGAGRQFQ